LRCVCHGDWWFGICCTQNGIMIRIIALNVNDVTKGIFPSILLRSIKPIRSTSSDTDTKQTTMMSRLHGGSLSGEASMGTVIMFMIAALSIVATRTAHAFAPIHPMAAGRAPPLSTTPSSTCQREPAFLWTTATTTRRWMSVDDDEASPSPQDEGASSPVDDESSSSALSSDTTDILNSPVFLKRKLEVLQKDMHVTERELEAAQEQLTQNKAEWSSQLDELSKEYRQIQSRMNAQNTQGDSMATIQVVRQILGVLDTFDRAFGVVQPTTDEERAVEAEYRQVYEGILETFTKLGVEVVPTLGIEFDYEIHQAVMQKPSDEYGEGIVCEEFQKGFKFGDQLVRAAMVAVAA
jgi:molecular chaperone GrpE